MYSEVTSVYVPVKTPDYKTWAILLSVLVHGLLLASLLFFYHTSPPPPMETSLVTPEELSQIEGKIRANQLANASQSGSPAPISMADMLSNIGKPTQRDPATAKMMNDITAKETAWRKQQEKIAQQIDKEVAQEQQQFIDGIKAEEAAQQQALAQSHTAEQSTDEIQQRLKDEAAAYGKDALPTDSSQSPPTNSGQAVTIKASPSHGQNLPLGGNGKPRHGGSSGNAAGYLNQITGIIQSHWSPPTNSKGKKLEATFTISDNGTITNITISGSSDEAFKASLDKAIRAASPLPPPPNDDDVKGITAKFIAN